MNDKQFEAILENSNDIILAVDFNGVVRYANAALERVLGYAPERIIGTNAFQLLHQDDLPAAKGDFEQFRQGQGPFQKFEYRILHRNGSWRNIELVRSFFTDESGGLLMVVNAWDVTDLRSAQQALRESEERYRNLVNYSWQGIIIARGSPFRFLFVNSRAAEMFGYPENEMIGMSSDAILALIHPDDLEAANQRFAIIMKSGKSLPSREYRFIRKDRSICCIELFGCRVNYEGNPALQVTLLDVTDRKQAEEALRESEANFSALAENANDAILIAVNDRSHEYANRRAGELTGFTIQELRKTGSNRLTQPGETEKLKAVRNRSRSLTASRHQYETQLIRKDKTLVPVEVSVSKTVWHGKSADLVLVRDITERKKMEERIRQDVEEKDVLLKEIHHRVKNNMQIISSLLNLQSQYVKDKKTLGMFKESQNRIRSMALIHERLYQSDNLARVNFGEYAQILAFELFKMYGVRMETIQLRIRIRNQLLDVHTAIPCGLIINELVSNALKYAFPVRKKSARISRCEPLRITITARRIRATRYLLSVADNGVGLPKEFDWHKCRTLGLRIVKALAGQMDGELKVHQKKGTEWVVLFDAQDGN